MENKSIHEIISTVFKALTLAMGVAVVCYRSLAVWKNKPILLHLALALPVRV